MSLLNCVSDLIEAGYRECPVEPRSKNPVHNDRPSTDHLPIGSASS